jgi:hypothetical protein
MGFMMARYVNFYVLSILMMLIGLTLDAKKEDIDDESPVYTRYVAEITRAFSKQIKKEFGLECIGNGGSMPYDVEEISIKFAAYQRATVEQARELEVKITERFVQMINAHEKIRPFLRETPFPSYRASVELSFYQRNNAPYMDGSVAFVFPAKGRIYYRAEDPGNPYIYKGLKDEPYEEALKIVQSDASKQDPQRSDPF